MDESTIKVGFGQFWTEIFRRVAGRWLKRGRAIGCPSTSPPNEAVEVMESPTNSEKEVSVNMPEALTQDQAVRRDVTIPSRDQICELDDLIRLVEAERSEATREPQEEPREAEESTLPLVTVGSVDEIVEEISTYVSSSLDNEAAMPSDLRAEFDQIMDEESELDFDPDGDTCWMPIAIDEEPRLTQRHPDLTVMRKKYATIQNCLSIFLGSTLGMVAVRFRATVLKPLRGVESLQTALLVAVLLTLVVAVFKFYLQYVVTKDRLENWAIMLVLSMIGTGMLGFVVQNLGMFSWVYLKYLDFGFYQLDILLVAGVVLTIYYMVRGVWYHWCYAEAMTAALNDTQELNKLNQVESNEVIIDYGQKAPPKASSLSLRWFIGQMRSAQRVLASVDRAA